MRPDVTLALGLFWAGCAPQLTRCGVRGLMPRLGGEPVIDVGGGFGAGPQDLDRLLAIRLDKLFGGSSMVVLRPMQSLTWVNRSRSGNPGRFRSKSGAAR